MEARGMKRIKESKRQGTMESEWYIREQQYEGRKSGRQKTGKSIQASHWTGGRDS